MGRPEAVTSSRRPSVWFAAGRRAIPATIVVSKEPHEPAETRAPSAAAPSASVLSSAPPYLCCVRIDRLQVRGARHANDGAAAPRHCFVDPRAASPREYTSNWRVLVDCRAARGVTSGQ